MPTVTLRPTSHSIGSGAWTINGGSATHTDAVNDVSTTTGIANAFGSANNFIRFFMGNMTLPALAQVRSVTPRLTLSTGGVSNGIHYSIVVTDGTRNGPQSYFASNQPKRTVSGTPSIRTPDGDEWYQTALDNLAVDIVAPDSGAGSLVWNVYVDVVYNLAPTVTVDIASTITNDSQPNVPITYTDGDGDGKERHRLKIFTATQVATQGFHADFTVPYYDSGEVYDSHTIIPVGIRIPNGDYYFFVKAADIGSNGRYSAWANKAVTINIPAITVPTITVSADNTLARNVITATVAVNQTIEIERSLDSGVTWTKPILVLNTTLPPALLSDVAMSTTGGSYTVYDYSAPRNKLALYRARAYKHIVSGSNYAGYSDYSSTGSSTLTLDTKWILKCPYAPSLNTKFDMKGPTWQRQSTEIASFFNPIGRKYKVKISDVIQGDSFPLTAFINSQAELDKLVAIRNTQKPILIQAPDGRQWYVNFANAVTFDELFLGNTIEVAMAFEETDAVSS